jgi:glyceraldehyde 3-phosphate dehydrogenase
MVPTTTGAAKAIGKVIPELEGKLNGFAVRVPAPTVSAVDLTVLLSTTAGAEEINSAFRKAAEGRMRGILQVCDEPLVSVDFKGNPHSAILDSPSTMVVGEVAKVLGWYDNEWAYAKRLAELAEGHARPQVVLPHVAHRLHRPQRLVHVGERQQARERCRGSSGAYAAYGRTRR